MELRRKVHIWGLVVALIFLSVGSVNAISSSNIASSSRGQSVIQSSVSAPPSTVTSSQVASKVSSIESYAGGSYASSQISASSFASRITQKSPNSNKSNEGSSANYSAKYEQSSVAAVSSAMVERSEIFSSSETASSSLFILPEVAIGDISVPHALDTESEPVSQGNSFVFGLIAWGCIILGVLIVMLVLFGGKKDKQSFIGRKKYQSRAKKNKRLLPDKYYRNLKKRK